MEYVLVIHICRKIDFTENLGLVSKPSTWKLNKQIVQFLFSVCLFCSSIFSCSCLYAYTCTCYFEVYRLQSVFIYATFLNIFTFRIIQLTWSFMKKLNLSIFHAEFISPKDFTLSWQYCDSSGKDCMFHRTFKWKTSVLYLHLYYRHGI